MANDYINKITATDGTTYDIKDTVSGYVTGMTTTAGAHTAGAQTVSDGIITTNIPTKTSHLTNDSGFITSDSDEKLRVETISNDTDYSLLLMKSSGRIPRTDTGNIKPFEFSVKTDGSSYSRLNIGGFNFRGQIGLGYNNNGITYYTYLDSTHTSASRTISFPDKTGTVALTSDIPTVPTITLNGTATTSPSFYAPTTAGTSGYVLKSNGSGAPTWTSATLTDTKVTQTASTTSAWRKVLGSYNSATAADGSITSDTANVSYYDADGPSFNTSTGELYTKGYKMYLATTDSLYTAINNLGWVSAVIE